jgi:long-chain-fatty-acid--CoA ligase ACSBG
MAEPLGIETPVDSEQVPDGVPIMKPSEPKKRVLITRIDQEAEIRMGKVGMSGRKPETVCEMLERTTSKFPSTDALCVKRDGEWKKWTYAEYLADVRRAAKSLIKVGLERFAGVCIMGFNAPEWLIGSLGTIYAG